MRLPVIEFLWSCDCHMHNRKSKTALLSLTSGWWAVFTLLSSIGDQSECLRKEAFFEHERECLCNALLFCSYFLAQSTKFLTLDDIVNDAGIPVSRILICSVKKGQLHHVCDVRGKTHTHTHTPLFLFLSVLSWWLPAPWLSYPEAVFDATFFMKFLSRRQLVLAGVHRVFLRYVNYSCLMHTRSWSARERERSNEGGGTNGLLQ